MRNGNRAITAARSNRAIYDVKTLDAELFPKRVRLLRTATRVDPSVYVIDLHVERGATLKLRRIGVVGVTHMPRSDRQEKKNVT